MLVGIEAARISTAPAAILALDREFGFCFHFELFDDVELGFANGLFPLLIKFVRQLA